MGGSKEVGTLETLWEILNSISLGDTDAEGG